MRKEWIENFKRFVEGLDKNERRLFIGQFEEKCDEKGYSYQETKELVNYVFN